MTNAFSLCIISFVIYQEVFLMEVSVAEFMVSNKNCFEITYTFPFLLKDINGFKYCFYKNPDINGKLTKKMIELMENSILIFF